MHTRTWDATCAAASAQRDPSGYGETKRRRGTCNSRNWVAGAVRILKRDASGTLKQEDASESCEELGFERVDAAFHTAARLDIVDRAILMLGSKMDELSDTIVCRFGVVEESITGISDSVKEVTMHINNAAKILNDHTLKSLHENDTVLRELII